MGASLSKKNFRKSNKRKKKEPTRPDVVDQAEGESTEEHMYEYIAEWNAPSRSRSFQDSGISENSSEPCTRRNSLLVADLTVSLGADENTNCVDRHFDVRNETQYSSHDFYWDPDETCPKRIEHSSCDASDDDTITCNSDMSLYLTSDSETVLKKDNTDSIENVEYMVEVFLPLLEQIVDVKEVIPHIPFIDAKEFIHNDSHAVAVTLLIDRIKSSEEPGKWQTFLDALRITEYGYIVSLLREDTEQDFTIHRNLLKVFTPQILSRIDPEEMMDHLFEKNVINESDMQQVKRENERRGANAASFLLLWHVPRRVSNWSEMFIEVLKKCGMEDVAENLVIPENTVLTRETQIPNSDKRTQRRKRCRHTISKNFLTPADEKAKRRPNLPPLPPLPDQKPNTLSNRNIPNPPTFVSEISQPPESVASSIHYSHYRNEYASLNNFKHPEVEGLEKRRAELIRNIEMQKLIKQMKEENKMLEEELKKIAIENSVCNIYDGSAISTEIGKSSTIQNCHGVISSTEMALPEAPQRANEEHNSNNKVLKDKMTSNTSDDDVLQETVKLLTNAMKEELKQEIIAMRDHVTEAVIKTLVYSKDTEVRTNEYNYVDVFLGLSMTNDYRNVNLFSLNGPKPHMQKRMNIVSDML